MAAVRHNLRRLKIILKGVWITMGTQVLATQNV